MESIQATPSFMPPVGARTLSLWTQLLQTDDSQLIDILHTGFEDGFSSFEEAWEQLQQLSPSLLNTSLAAKQDSFLMGVPFECVASLLLPNPSTNQPTNCLFFTFSLRYILLTCCWCDCFVLLNECNTTRTHSLCRYFLPTQRSTQLLTYVVQRGFRPGVYNYGLAERLIHTNGWATSQEGFDGAFFITPFIVYTDEAAGGWQLSQLAPSPAFPPATSRHRIPASSSGSIASSSQESSQPSDALARERAELSQLMFTATQTLAELILNKVAAIGSPEAEAEILSKFNPGNHSWRVHLRIGVLSSNTRLATLQALLKAKQAAVNAAAAAAASSALLSPAAAAAASLGLPSSSQESPMPSLGTINSILFTPPSTPLRTTAIVAASPTSLPSASSSAAAAAAAASSPQQRVAAKLSDSDLNMVYCLASNVVRHYQLADENGAWLSPLMPIYG
ncbi:hypothetical protein QOT17_005498 [Balamuthia mandrillaris]